MTEIAKNPYSTPVAFPVSSEVWCAAAGCARPCNWEARASAGNVCVVDADVGGPQPVWGAEEQLSQLPLPQYRPVAGAGVLPPGVVAAAVAPAADGSAVVHCPLVPGPDNPPLAYRNAMCHWRLSVNIQGHSYLVNRKPIKPIIYKE